MIEELMDADLVKLARSGSHDARSRAFDTLVGRYQRKVTQLVYRYVRDMDTALDIVQDIFFKIFRNLSSFKGDCAFSTWLYRISVNVCIDHTRRRKVRQESSLEQAQERGFDAPDTRPGIDASKLVMDKMEQAAVRKALGSLSTAQMSVVVMKVYQEMTFDEIADILDLPVSTIKSRLYKAFEKLGKTMRRNEFFDKVAT